MEIHKKILPPELLLEEYRRLIREEERIGALPLVISGGSMSPFLIGGRDMVYLSRVDRPIRRGDALLYQRRNGSYVFHRVFRVTEQGYTMVGDAQTVLEPGIGPEQIIAIMTGAERKGKYLGPGSFWWEFFEKVWIRLIPVRRPLLAAYALLYRLRHGQNPIK